MSDAPSERISRIETAWTLLRQAHGPDGDAARQLLVARYRGAAFRYLRKAVGEADADDLAQEFSVALLTGRYAGADPSRGRFRDYVRVSLANLIAAHRRKPRRSVPHKEGQFAEPATTSDDGFDEAWREQLLERAMSALRDVRLAWFEALRLKAERPDISSPELAAALQERLGKPQTADGVRQLLHRAREEFADLLLEEVAHSLERPTVEALADELAEVGLLEKCRPALARRGS